MGQLQKYKIAFLVLFLQVFVVRYINLSNPYCLIYLQVLILVYLPVQQTFFQGLPQVLFFGFLFDLLDNSWGLHLSTFVFAAYIRQLFLPIFLEKEENIAFLSIKKIGLKSFFYYVFVICFAFYCHFLVIDQFVLMDWKTLIYQCIGGAFLMSWLVVGIDYLFVAD